MSELLKIQTPQARRVIADGTTSLAANAVLDFFDNAHSVSKEYNELPDGMFRDGVSGFITGIGFWNATQLHSSAQLPADSVSAMGTLADFWNHMIVVASVSGVEFYRGPLVYSPTPNIWVAGNMVSTTTDSVAVSAPNGWRPTFGRHPFAERARIKVQLLSPTAFTMRDINRDLVIACGLTVQSTQPLA